MFTASEGYERFMGRWSRVLAPAYAAFAGVRDGQRVLDVGCGTGVLSGVLAARGPRCRITGIDPSEPFIRSATAAHGSERVDFAVGDASALTCDAGTFDHAMALLVLNFVADPVAAVARMVRVTRPGGIVSAAVWDYGDGMAMLRIFWDEAVALEPDAGRRDERHMRLARAGELRALWQQSGLVDVHEEPLVIEQVFDSFDDYWQPFLLGVGPAGAHAASRSAAQREALAQRLRRRLLGSAADGPLRLTARAWAVRGRVAAAG